MFNEKRCPEIFIQKRLLYENRHEPYHMRIILPISLLKDFLLCSYHEVLRNRGVSLLDSERFIITLVFSRTPFTLLSIVVVSKFNILLLLCPRSPFSGPLPPMPLPLAHYIKRFFSLRSLIFLLCSI